MGEAGRGRGRPASRPKTTMWMEGINALNLESGGPRGDSEPITAGDGKSGGPEFGPLTTSRDARPLSEIFFKLTEGPASWQVGKTAGPLREVFGPPSCAPQDAWNSVMAMKRANSRNGAPGGDAAGAGFNSAAPVFVPGAPAMGGAMPMQMPMGYPGMAMQMPMQGMPMQGMPMQMQPGMDNQGQVNFVPAMGYGQMGQQPMGQMGQPGYPDGGQGGMQMQMGWQPQMQMQGQMQPQMQQQQPPSK